MPSRVTLIVISNEEHRLENLEPEPGEPRWEILEAWAWAYFENHEPEPKFWAPSLSLSLEPKLKYWFKYHKKILKHHLLLMLKMKTTKKAKTENQFYKNIFQSK